MFLNEFLFESSGEVVDLRDHTIPVDANLRVKTHIVLTDNGAIIFYYGEGNTIPWREVSQQTYPHKPIICYTSDQGIKIDQSRETASWSGWRNRYSTDNATIVRRLLDLNLTSPESRVYIGNWASKDNGEFIGTAAVVAKRTELPKTLVLYHGTSSARLPLILSQGLVPISKETRVWNKEKLAPDHRSDCVYLAANINTAEYYARKATNVDRHRLSWRFLYEMKRKVTELKWKVSQFPSEFPQSSLDALENKLNYYNSLYRELPDDKKITPIVLQIRLTPADSKRLMADDDFLNKNTDMEPDGPTSLSHFGQVAYRGTISPNKITVLKN